jgi:hypothetical protein
MKKCSSSRFYLFIFFVTRQADFQLDSISIFYDSPISRFHDRNSNFRDARLERKKERKNLRRSP